MISASDAPISGADGVPVGAGGVGVTDSQPPDASESEPDPDRYARHVEDFVAQVDCSAFRHGRIFGAPFGEPSARYYAEFEWDDMTAFKAAVSSDSFAASGKDAMEMGIPFTVDFAEIG